jgi:23S rRNA (pseudouridine1915-N3)-methyltransferase
MKFELWWIGKTNEKYLNTGIDIFAKRIKNYYHFQMVELKDVKSVANPNILMRKESETILKRIDHRDFLILLDEKGQSYSSLTFANMIEKLLHRSNFKKIVFLIAGAYGANDSLKERANLQLSLSELTFSHQMIRLIFLEQLYRACTIIKNEKYHNP